MKYLLFIIIIIRYAIFWWNKNTLPLAICKYLEVKIYMKLYTFGVMWQYTLYNCLFACTVIEEIIKELLTEKKIKFWDEKLTTNDSFFGELKNEYVWMNVLCIYYKM